MPFPEDPHDGRSRVAGYNVLWLLKGSRDKMHRAVTCITVSTGIFLVQARSREVDISHKEGN